MQRYKRNDPENIWSILEICPEEERAKSLLYRREFLLTDKKISLEDIQQKCGDCKIIRQIIDRAIEGNLRYLDRLVLAGCFGKVDRGNFLIDIMSNQSNYKADVTQKYLDAVKERYYPITFMYLYDLYDEQMEDELDPKETILSYVAKKLGLSDSIRSLEEVRQKESKTRGAGKSRCGSVGNATGRKAWRDARAAPFLKRTWRKPSSWLGTASWRTARVSCPRGRNRSRRGTP